MPGDLAIVCTQVRGAPVSARLSKAKAKAAKAKASPREEDEYFSAAEDHHKEELPVVTPIASSSSSSDSSLPSALPDFDLRTCTLCSSQFYLSRKEISFFSHPNRFLPTRCFQCRSSVKKVKQLQNRAKREAELASTLPRLVDGCKVLFVQTAWRRALAIRRLRRAKAAFEAVVNSRARIDAIMKPPPPPAPPPAPPPVPQPESPHIQRSVTLKVDALHRLMHQTVVEFARLKETQSHHGHALQAHTNQLSNIARIVPRHVDGGFMYSGTFFADGSLNTNYTTKTWPPLPAAKPPPAKGANLQQNDDEESRAEASVDTVGSK